jgi:hypothetical protein
MHPTNPTTWGYQQPVPPPAPPAGPPRKRRRIFPWLFLATQVLFLVLIITAAHSSHNQTVANCATQSALSAQDCQSASNAGTAIGVGLLVAFWVAFDLIVGITYAIIRLARRQ